MKKHIAIFFIIFSVMSVTILWICKTNASVMSWFPFLEKLDFLNQTKGTILIDPGHGGFDPGKVGINDALEKDINLSISLKLKTFLEENNYEVILTRSDDNGLYEEGDSNKKRTDMRKRVEIINNSNALAAVSIHQNSFPEQSSKGAQVFYHVKSAKGKEFAEIMQEQIKTTLADNNHRGAKSNDNYYMLKKTTCPLVIVECGFLSNPDEAALLCDEAYQEKLAWAIHLGILKYLSGQE